MGFLTKNNAETMHNYQNGLEQCSTNGKKKKHLKGHSSGQCCNLPIISALIALDIQAKKCSAL